MGSMMLGCEVPYLVTRTHAEGQDWYRRMLRRNREYRGGRGTVAWIMRDAMGRPSGALLVKLAAPEAMLVYWVSPEARGQGLAKAAVEGILPWLAEQGVRLVRADIQDDNHASRRVLESNGFTERTDSLAHPGVRRFGREL